MKKSIDSLLSITFSLWLAAISLAPARADFDVKKWQYCRDIARTAGADPYGEVVLEPEVLRRANGGLTDIRIVNSQGREVAYKLIQDAGGRTRESVRHRLLNKSVVRGKYTSFVIDLGKTGTITNGIDIGTTSRNFTRKVEIEGGDDLSHWAAVGGGYVFDFSHGYESRRTSISYSESAFRYIRVRILNSGEKPLEISGAEIFLEKVRPAKEVVVYSGRGSVTQNREQRSTDVVFDTKSEWLPAGRLYIESPDTNYDRQIEVDVSRDGKSWSNVASGSIHNYNTPKFKDKVSTVALQGCAGRYIRLRIFNYDDRPIAISNLALGAYRTRLFFPLSEGLHKIYYGNPNAGRPVYDIESTFNYLESVPAVRMSLGQEMKNTSYVRQVETRPWFQENPWVLWAALIGAVVFLGVYIVRLIQQMGPTEPQG